MSIEQHKTTLGELRATTPTTTIHVPGSSWLIARDFLAKGTQLERERERQRELASYIDSCQILTCQTFVLGWFCILPGRRMALLGSGRDDASWNGNTIMSTSYLEPVFAIHYDSYEKSVFLLRVCLLS